MIRVYSEFELGDRWLQHYRQRSATFACVLGFTETGLLPEISAAGATPRDRQWTAIADAEFLFCGPQAHPQFPLPPLIAGVSPALITRTVLSGLALPLHLFNAGLPHPPTVPSVDLSGQPARCVSTGAALPLTRVDQLFRAGLTWGTKLADLVPDGYLILGECVVGGTTTALAVLTGLGWQAEGKVNSSHVTCNHTQKWAIAQAGLQKASLPDDAAHPLAVVAAVGDPMQAVVTGMAIAASQHCGVMLAGGTQMLAVYALIQALLAAQSNDACSLPPHDMNQIVVGTTRWVAEDPTGDTVGLARLLKAPLLATQLNFSTATHEALRAYEQGFVKEGVGAGGCAIAASLRGWDNSQLVQAIEDLLEQRLILEKAESPLPGG